MTEQEWLESVDPTTMLEFLRDKASDRKLRLFACACCRQVWHRLEDERSRRAVELTERYFEGEVSACDWSAAFFDCWDSDRRTFIFQDALQRTAARTAYWKTGFASPGILLGGYEAAQSACQGAWEADNRFSLLRDIFGNPFRPVTLDPTWLTPTLTNLAMAAYEERSLPSGELDPARLAVLADALEEAGCTKADILGHLREPGPHVRGCFALDLILAEPDLACRPGEAVVEPPCLPFTEEPEG
jgi:hypothetical protein